MEVNYFRELVVENKNHFETLRISPEVNIKDIVVFISKTKDIEAHKKIIQELNRSKILADRQ